jgi:hypothetical protein
MKPRIRKIIGRRELVSFPDLGLYDIEAKIDTGAYTSSIHCKEVELIHKNGQDYVSFRMQHPLIKDFGNNRIEWPLYKTKLVKNSFGQVEERFVFKSRISFYDELYDIELSLADRSLMDYPLLLGRKTLKRKFVVDVSKIHYAAKNKTCLIQ